VVYFKVDSNLAKFERAY